MRGKTTLPLGWQSRATRFFSPVDGGAAFACLSGVLLALSFPRYGHPAFGFIALTPLYVALSGWTGRGGMPGVSTWRGFWLGLVAGIVHFAGTVYWTSGTVATFGELPWVVAVPVAGLLVLYMALYVAVASAASAIMIRRLGRVGLLLAPSAWVAAEYARAHIIGGFPWIPLGNAVVSMLPLVQMASLTGVYGVSWLLATVHACFAIVAMSGGRARLLALGFAVLLLAGPSLWGAARIRDGRLTRDGESISVALVQGNVPQGEKWDPARAGTIFARYLQMTADAAAGGARFVLWPESSTPFYFDEDARSADRMRRMVAAGRFWLLFGSDHLARGTPNRTYNSAYMLDDHGATSAIYHKIYLVPFGEYVPFGSILSFVGPIVEAVAAFSAGQEVTMLPVNGHMVSTAICYEVVYPHLIRQGVLNGSELLTTITNDAWYGESSAPFQHFELAVMRSIEQGRYLLRAANTGISGIVDPYGRVLVRTELFVTETVTGEVRFRQERTLYAKIGDLPAQLAVLLTIVGVGVSLAGRRSMAKS